MIVAPARAAMSPAAATSQTDRPWVWANASNRPAADVGQGEGRGAEPAGHPDLVPDRIETLGQLRAVDRERDHEVGQQLLGR